MLRTHTCGELTKKDEGKKVKLSGWVDSIRAHGKMGFVDLRDRYGITQIVFFADIVDKIRNIKVESVISVEGTVVVRPKPNPNLKTGKIEIHATNVSVFSEAEELPISINDKGNIESSDETRLKYRFLDLRTKRMQRNLWLRHRVIKAIRDFLDSENFIEVETPILAKSTPEGARDYLVPSRLYKGNFYALPQSPQLFKQLLMIAGYDRYFQIAKCFRDEDLRADRQPEFTQLDLEMSFITEEDIYDLLERLMKYVFKKVMNIELKTPFERMEYDEAMSKYKSDKPDLRKEKDEFKFEWIVNFPMFEYSEENKKYKAKHHPFTLPKGEDFSDMESVKSFAYDLVLNGWEMGSGSIRIHDRNLQLKVLKALGIDEKEAEEKFGFLLNAMRYGNPPVGGIAIGIDRLVAILAGEKFIRDVVAFPKNSEARDLMLDCPSEVTESQLNDLGITIK